MFIPTLDFHTLSCIFVKQLHTSGYYCDYYEAQTVFYHHWATTLLHTVEITMKT